MKNKTSRGVIGLSAALALILSGPLAAVAQTPAGAPAAKPAAAKPATHPFAAAAVDSARLLAADSEPGSWLASGRTYSEQRYSLLTGVNKANVSKLGLAWYGDIDTERGQESTPVVVDGALYVTTAWSKVKAYDAARPAGSSGTTIPRSTRPTAPSLAAMLSTAASRPGRASSTSAPWTAG